MKLAQYTIRKLILPLFIIMAVWACVFYFLILHEVNDETNDTLENYKELIIKQALLDSSVLDGQSNLMASYHIREIPREQANLSKDEFFDSTKYIELEKEHEPIRVLRTSFMASDGKYYELQIELSTLEKEDLIETVFWGIIILYVLLLCCILIVSHYIFKKSFHPLYTILEWLRNFHPGRPVQPLLNETNIEEFDTLNKAFETAARRNIKLYEEQKQFVENASHELQTPLAVSLNKLELLSENPNCTEEQLSEIEDVSRTLRSIVSLNKSLLLLSKIENNQFPEKKSISITELVKGIIDDFSEIFENKQIRIYYIKEESLSCDMNEALANTLIKNLIRNAFVHNIPSGDIYIEISEESLSIENTSNAPELNKEKLFQRFGKQSNRADSNGLGLAIVKSISSMYGVQLSYFYNGKHRFILKFKLVLMR